MLRRGFLATTAATCLTRGASAAAALQRQIRITGLETDLLQFPPGKAEYNATQRFGPDRGGVVVRLLTDAGITGWAYSSFGLIAGAPRTLQAMLMNEVKPLLLGQDPAFPKRIRADLWRALEYQGMQGLTAFALSAVDIALWDILGKAANLPVYKMLGAFRDRLPAYSMCGWYYDNDADLSEFRRAISAALEEDFRGIKIKIGYGPLEDDVRRIRTARDLAGKQRDLMVDANQGFTPVEALRRGRVYQEMGCFWLEEPFPSHRKDDLAELAARLDMRIATGENDYSRHGFMELMTRRAVDVVQPDNRRAGGVTEWMEIGAIADAFGLELASHGGGATNMNMLLAMPNAIYIESGSLKNSSQKMIRGEILGPTETGMSSALDKSYIAKYKVG